MADVKLNDHILNTIADLQADDCKGAKEEVAFLDNMISLKLVELSQDDENFSREFNQIQRLNDIRQYLQSFIPDEK